VIPNHKMCGVQNHDFGHQNLTYFLDSKIITLLHDITYFQQHSKHLATTFTTQWQQSFKQMSYLSLWWKMFTHIHDYVDIIYSNIKHDYSAYKSILKSGSKNQLKKWFQKRDQKMTQKSDIFDPMYLYPQKILPLSPLLGLPLGGVCASICKDFGLFLVLGVKMTIFLIPFFMNFIPPFLIIFNLILNENFCLKSDLSTSKHSTVYDKSVTFTQLYTHFIQQTTYR